LDGEVETTLELGLGVDFEYVLTVKRHATSGKPPGDRFEVKAEPGLDGRTLKLWLAGGQVPREAVLTFGEMPKSLDASGALGAVVAEARIRMIRCVVAMGGLPRPPSRWWKRRAMPSTRSGARCRRLPRAHRVSSARHPTSSDAPA
jgi:hypothetical protein